MRWAAQAPFHQDVLRVRLRSAARRFARHGWAVTPGGYFNGERMACDRSDCWATSCHPVLTDWETQSSTWSEQLADWWRVQPHAVLLPTGHTFDVIEVPALLGRGAAGQAPGPIAVTATGRWMFLVTPGADLVPELDHRDDVVLHGLGSWIPAPPTVLPEGVVRWQVPPAQVEWVLPEASVTQRALVRALVTLDAAFLDLPLSARRRLNPPPLATMESALRRA